MENKEIESRQKEMRKGNLLFSLIQSLIASISALIGIEKRVIYPFSSSNHVSEFFFPIIQGTNLIVSIKSLKKISKDHKKHRTFRIIFLISAISLSILVFILIRLYVYEFIGPLISGNLSVSSLNNYNSKIGLNILPRIGEEPVPAYGVFTRNRKPDTNSLGIR